MEKKTKIALLGPFFLVFGFYIIIFIKKLIKADFELPTHFEAGTYVYLDFLSVIFTLIIMFYSLQIIIKYEEDKTYDIKYVKSETAWLKKLIYIGFYICLLWLSALLVVVLFNIEKSVLFYPVWISISALVYWIGYVGLNKSNQLKKSISLRKKRLVEIENSTTSEITGSSTFEQIEKGIRLRHKLSKTTNGEHQVDQFNDWSIKMCKINQTAKCNCKCWGCKGFQSDATYIQ